MSSTSKKRKMTRRLVVLGSFLTDAYLVSKINSVFALDTKKKKHQDGGSSFFIDTPNKHIHLMDRKAKDLQQNEVDEVDDILKKQRRSQSALLLGKEESKNDRIIKHMQELTPGGDSLHLLTATTSNSVEDINIKNNSLGKQPILVAQVNKKDDVDVQENSFHAPRGPQVQHPISHVEQGAQLLLREHARKLKAQTAGKKARGQIDDPLEQLEEFVDTESQDTVSDSSAFPTISASEYQALFQAFVNNQKTRYIGDLRNVGRAEHFITDKFEKLGLKVNVQTFEYAGIPCHNIIGTFSGSDESLPEIVVGAHFDSIPERGPAPGADDNASGVTGLMTIAKTVMEFYAGKQPPRRTLKFVAFSAEEEGLVGSTAFVEEEVKQKQKKIYEALILDEVSYQKAGSNATALIFETVEKKEPQQHLINVLGKVGKKLLGSAATSSAPSALSAMVNYHGFGSDHIPFLNADSPAVLLIERDNLYYADNFGHTSKDTLSNVKWDFARNVAQLATNTVLELATSDGKKDK